MLANKIMGATSAAPDLNYIEDVFSTYLYTGNGATQTITNGIDLAGKGGLVWFKPRNTANNHNLIDSARGLNKFLITNSTAANGTTGAGYGVSSFNSTGFSLDPPWTSSTNTTDTTYASWTFRKQPKFFDVVTYTGDGISPRLITHALGSVPGCIIVKRTDSTSNWQTYHRALDGNSNLYLNTTDGTGTIGSQAVNTPTTTTFRVSGGSGGPMNISGAQYVAYIFAHDAGGFGLSGNDNVISCGSFTAGASGATVSLGFEPQWLLLKGDGTDWYIVDNMRGFGVNAGPNKELLANSSYFEQSSDTNGIALNGNGFSVGSYYGGNTYIYIAIRRGPMKVPTLGTTVYNGITRTGTGAVAQVTGVGFPPDLVASGFRNFGGPPTFFDKLRGPLQYLTSSAANTEATRAGTLTSFDQNGFSLGADAFNLINFNTGTFVDWNFRRAPSFFDEVCYTGTGAARTVAHNLTVAPELMIVKSRTDSLNWFCYQKDLGPTKYIELNLGDSAGTYSVWNNTIPTASVFSVGSDNAINVSGSNIVAYLFATCAGVSKVGTYTGTGATQAIACGFTAGARFVLIKRTDAAGDWYVWDSARGIVANSDPYLLLNSTAAEVTGTDYIDPVSSGFEISSTAPAAINASGGSYIFLAVA